MVEVVHGFDLQAKSILAQHETLESGYKVKLLSCCAVNN